MLARSWRRSVADIGKPCSAADRCAHCRAAERVQEARKARQDAVTAVACVAEGFVSAKAADLPRLHRELVRAVLAMWDAEAAEQQAVAEMEETS